MGRPRRKKQSEDELEQDLVQPSEAVPPSEPVPPSEVAGAEPARDPDEPTVAVRMQGRASKVAELMTKNKRGRADQEDEDGEPRLAPTTARKLHRNLQNPRNRVFVKRVKPIEWEGRKADYEVYSQDCPLTVQDIQQIVVEKHGGGLYQARVSDRQTGEVADAFTFECDDDPILKPAQQPFGFQEIQEPSDEDKTEEQMEQMIRLNQKRITMETLNQQLSELKDQRPRNGQSNPVVEAKIAKLETLMTQKAEQDRITALEAKHQREMDALYAKLAELSNPKDDAQKSDRILELMMKQQEQAAADRRASDDRFMQFMQAQSDQKLANLATEIRELRNAPAKNADDWIDNLHKAREVVKIMAPGAIGGGLDPDDPMTVWMPIVEKVVETLSSGVQAFVKSRVASGTPISRDEFVRQFPVAAGEAAHRVVMGPGGVPGLPAPKPVINVPPPPATTARVEAPVGTFKSRTQVSRPAAPPPPPPPVAQAPNPVATVSARPAPAPAPPAPTKLVQPEPPPAPPVAPVAEAPALPSVDDEVRERVGGVMAVMDREMAIRPNRYSWPKYAWDEFPGDLLDAVVQSKDGLEMIAVIYRFLGVDAAASVAQLQAHPKVIVWLGRGLSDLKSAYAEHEKDPSFDPFADDDEEEEEDDGGNGAVETPDGVGAIVDEGPSEV